ncbi:MAG: alpha-ketoglutarate-dependent dioxygenase AlkB [Gammaproteobacteria bacterium]|nr:alpha-ketoglutarate-dependent dioxygenase AlkB [Gammaproteobacteria bacterium]MDH5801904.1 alpha-ketoglutarate-dependent dioxygenase AlkB [Gammaproteobacteria bacterium]
MVTLPGDNIIAEDGFVFYVAQFLPLQNSQDYFEQLKQSLQWQSESYTIYGKTVAAPRRVAWYGDAGASYAYSGIVHAPLPWNTLLLQLRDQIQSVCKQPLNSVLANLYRDGKDSMGWHADQEPELGPNPFIASLSLGEMRVFKLRHRKTKRVVKLELNSGSLLIMAGELQHHWQHCVPKTAIEKQARINLTFRNIVNL